MKNKIRVDVVLFVILSIIMLYFLILNSIEQKHFEQNYNNIFYNNTSIIYLDVKIYPALFGNNISSDRIVPIGSIIFVDVTILNKGPSDLCEFGMRMQICDQYNNCEYGNDNKKSNSPLNVGEKRVLSFGGYHIDKEGNWKYTFELSSESCRKTIEKGETFELQAVSLNTYYQYKTNKNVEFLTLVALFLSALTISFSFNEVKKYTKKLIKILTQGWFK